MTVHLVYRRACRRFLIVAALLACPSTSPAAPPSAAAHTEPRDFIAYNFRLRGLPDGWSWRDVADPTTQVVAFAENAASGETLLVKAYTVGTDRMREPDAILADLQAMLTLRGTNFTGLKKLSSIIGGVDGYRITADADRDQRVSRFVGFVGARAGREYQIGYFTPASAKEAQVTADELLRRFDLIDPNAAVRLADLADAPPWFSPIYKYRFTLPAGWSKPLSPALKEASVDYSSMFADHSCVSVTPTLITTTTKPDDVAAALLRIYGWDAALMTPRSKFDAGRFTGYRFTRDSAVAGRKTRQRLQVWVGEGVALYAVATTTFKDPEPILAEALSGMDLSKVVGAKDPDIRSHLLSMRDLFSTKRPLRDKDNPRGFLQNELGVELVNRGDSRTAAQLFEVSLQYQLDPQVVANWLDALVKSDQLERAREAAPLAAARLPDSPLVTAAVAYVYDTAGDRNAYLALAKSTMDAGGVNDELFYAHAMSLLDAQQYDAPGTLVANYKKKSQGPFVVDAEAYLLLDTGHAADAVALLDKNLQDNQKHPLLRKTLVITLLRDGQVDRAEREIGKLASDGVSDREIAVCRGQLFMKRGQSVDAKDQFEKARSLGLSAAEADMWVQLVDRLSGQGKNASVRAEIPPVLVPADLYANVPTVQLDRSMGAAYQRSATAIRYERGKPQRTTQDDIVEIYDQTGVNWFTTIKIKINPQDEKLYINLVEVRDSDGKVLSVGKPDDYYVLDTNGDTSGDEPATREQSINVPVAGLRPGCTLHVQTTREYLDAYDSIRFDEHLASQTLPVGQRVVFLTGVDPSKLALSEFNGAKRIERKDGIAWTFTTPPCYAPEPCMPAVNDFIPGVAIGDRSSNWKAQGLDYLSLIRDRLTPDAAVAREVKQLQLDTKPAIERLHAVVNYVQTHCAYKAIAFGPRAYIPSPPARIIEQRYGDCKDQALLIHLMLKEAGVASRLALVRMEGPVYPEIPTRTQFDHMIVHVPDCDGSWWIDTTNRDIQAIQTTPGPGLHGRHALELDPAEPKLVALPDWDPDDSGLTTKRSLAIAGDGAMAITDHTILRGLMAGYFRSALHETDQNRRNETAARMLGIDVSSVRSWSVKIGDLEDPSTPLSVEATYSPRARLKKTGSRLVGEMPTPAEHAYLLADAVEHRRLPFKLMGWMNYDVALEMTWPAGWTAEDLEANPTALDTPYARVKLSFGEAAATADGGGRLSGRLTVTSQRGVFPAAKYDDYCQSRQAILDAWAIPLVFRTTASNPAP